MNNVQTKLARKQLERRLAPLREINFVPPRRGWIRAIRESLGMTDRQLAARIGVTASRIPALEKAETAGGTTLKTLREAASALNCTFAYAFVPIEPLEEILRERAAMKARSVLSRLNHSMRLENQSVLATDLADELRRTADEIVAGSLRGLWDEEPAHHD